MDKKTIYRLIGKFDKKQLQELIAYIVSVNESAQESLLDYCEKKEKDIKTDNHALILESKIRQYWKNASGIIEEFDMYGGGPESDEDDAYGMLEDMMKLLEDNEVSWIVRKEILDEMLDFVASDNSGFTDYLMDIWKMERNRSLLKARRRICNMVQIIWNWRPIIKNIMIKKRL